MFNPTTITMTRAEFRDLLRQANEAQVAEHRAAYKAKLRARVEARRKERQEAPA